MQDVLIIGGGAGGLFLSVLIKKANPALSVTVAEQLERVGKKLSVTGNGRCNIANLKTEDKNYHTRCPKTAHRVLSLFDYKQTENFFSSIGVEFAAEGNKVYPLSFQASSVVDTLRFAADSNGVKTVTKCKVNKILKTKNGFRAVCDGATSEMNAKTVVVATGGMAGGIKLGSNGDGYKILKNFNHKIYDPIPVNVQVKTDNSITKQLKGIKVNCRVTLKDKNNTIAADKGEVLFCDYGLSGPPILQLSRFCKKGVSVSLDLLPSYSSEEVKKLIIKRKNIMCNIPLTDFFAGLLHKKIGQIIIKSCGISLNLSGKELSDFDCDKIARKIKNFTFTAEGNTGFINAQATSGGADLDEFDENLMSKKQKGLFALGEVLDVDGDCGGFNLQWAWSSAAAVCRGIIKYL